MWNAHSIHSCTQRTLMNLHIRNCICLCKAMLIYIKKRSQIAIYGKHLHFKCVILWLVCAICCPNYIWKPVQCNDVKIPHYCCLFFFPHCCIWKCVRKTCRYLSSWLVVKCQTCLWFLVEMCQWQKKPPLRVERTWLCTRMLLRFFCFVLFFVRGGGIFPEVRQRSTTIALDKQHRLITLLKTHSLFKVAHFEPLSKEISQSMFQCALYMILLYICNQSEIRNYCQLCEPTWQ